MIKEETRINCLNQWLRAYFIPNRMEPISGDASFRRYYRIFLCDTSFIAVDSPPEKENNLAFVSIAKRFLKEKLNVPDIIAANLEQGFLLLSDFGDDQLLDIINEQNVDGYYEAAIENLRRLQYCQDFTPWQLPVFDRQLLMDELYRFHEWYLVKHLKLNLSSQDLKLLHHTYELLVTYAIRQPMVCVHRDYHSKNLMILPNNALGILDFQDAVYGPISYDVVSLLKDCYITWPQERVAGWLMQFWKNNLSDCQRKSISLAEFTQFFDWMGLQRHLKVLGIFARLYYRDQKESYLQYLPRILDDYVSLVCDRYSEFNSFKRFLRERVLIS
jgi:N-acetylmuramate 1-kinase